jgi:hypothetical protein
MNSERRGQVRIVELSLPPFPTMPHRAPIPFSPEFIKE